MIMPSVYLYFLQFTSTFNCSVLKEQCQAICYVLQSLSGLRVNWIQKINQSNFVHVYVVVNFLSLVIVVFLLFLGMVMYANKLETKEKQKLPEVKN